MKYRKTKKDIFKKRRALWQHISENPGVSLRELMPVIGLNSTSSVWNHVEYLKRQGLVSVVPGSKRTLHAIIPLGTAKSVREVQMRRIYVASSWRNPRQPVIVKMLREAGHEVYDFRHPKEATGNGFHWSSIAENWKDWTALLFSIALDHPLAREGFKHDMDALEWCDTVLLVLPCGRSSHLELGWGAGAGKNTIILLDEFPEAELMYSLAGKVCVDIGSVLEYLKKE